MAAWPTRTDLASIRPPIVAALNEHAQRLVLPPWPVFALTAPDVEGFLSGASEDGNGVVAIRIDYRAPDSPERLVVQTQPDDGRRLDLPATIETLRERLDDGNLTAWQVLLNSVTVVAVAWQTYRGSCRQRGRRLHRRWSPCVSVGLAKGTTQLPLPRVSDGVADNGGVTGEGSRPAVAAAAGLAFGSAAVTAYWTVGGTALLDTVGGYPEELARSRTVAAVLVGILVVAVKIVGGVVALALATPPTARLGRRVVVVAAGAGAAVLTVYGGLLVAVGALVLTGVLDPGGPVDRRALRWHVLCWDLWFLLWGLALAVATWTSLHRTRSSVCSGAADGAERPTGERPDG
jgi:hypothetical protein